VIHNFRRFCCPAMAQAIPTKTIARLFREVAFVDDKTRISTRTTGDDPRLPPGRGKPHPDIWAACLASLNDKHGTNIEPHECLVFEDGIPGVEAGKALGAHVIWIPDPNALKVLQGRERHIIGNRGSIYGSITEFVPEHFGL
jgi:pseudouridine-5'-monophosphatase